MAFGIALFWGFEGPHCYLLIQAALPSKSQLPHSTQTNYLLLLLLATKCVSLYTDYLTTLKQFTFKTEQSINQKLPGH